MKENNTNFNYDSLSLKDKFLQVINKYSDKFEFESFGTKDYLKNGFNGILKIKIQLRTSKKTFNYGTAKIIIKENKLLILSGYLADIDFILDEIK